jgi:hypothetical protein
MLKLEGTSPKAPSGSISFHAGGFAGANATQRTVSISFPSEITVAKDGVNHVHVEADVLKLFKSPNLYDFANTYNISTAGAAAKGFADNYANNHAYNHYNMPMCMPMIMHSIIVFLVFCT